MENIIEVLAKMKQENLDMFKDVYSEINNITTPNDGEQGPIGPKGEDGKDGEQGPVGPKGYDGKDGEQGPKGKDGKNGKEGKQGERGQKGIDGRDGKDGSPDAPEDIRSKLESLTGDDRLDKAAIRGLDYIPTKKDFDKLLKQKNKGGLSVASFAGAVDGNTTVTTDGTYIGGDGTVGDPITLLGVSTDGTTVIGDGVNNPLSSISNPTGKYLVSGGISWSGSGYIYDVSALNYYFDGVFYTSTQTQVTMASADPTDNRFDAVVVDITGTVSVITGTASANPEFPTIPEDQLVVGYVLVEAGTLTPTLTTDNIYLDNAQWTTTTYTTGSGSLGSIDFNSTNAPYQGTKCAEATATNNRLGMKFTRGTAIDVQTFAFVQIWARLDAAVATNKNLNVRFDNSLGNPVGNTANLFNYGMSRTIVGTWQLVVIPVSAFGAITNVKGLRAIMAGGVISNTATWSLDFMILSGGILPQSLLGPIYLSPSGTLYSEGAATGATAVDDSIMFGTLAGFQATNANNSIFEGSHAGYGATNADNSIFLGTNAGLNSSSAYSSVFEGTDAGNLAPNAYQSVFIGRGAGQGATNANDSFFLGYTAGLNASGASASAFTGSEAGSGATNSTGSVFTGYQAGKGATDAANSIYIGTQAGLNSTSTTPGILIGAVSSTGGFENSIAIGTGATNTADNELIVGSSSSKIETTQIIGTGAFTPQVGTTAERPATPAAGMIRFNTTIGSHEVYNGTTWNPVGGSTAGSIGTTIDGGGGVITTGQKGGFITIPYSGTITGWTLFSTNGTTGAATSGSIVIDTWKDTYANFPPTVADTIWGGSKPTLTAQSKNTATGLSIAVTAGDVIGFYVDSVTTCTLVNLTILITKS